MISHTNGHRQWRGRHYSSTGHRQNGHRSSWNTAEVRKDLGFDPEAPESLSTAQLEAEVRAQQIPEEFQSRNNGRPESTKKKPPKPGTRPRIYLSQPIRDWHAQLRREGECGLLIMTQNVAEALVTLPAQQGRAYQYMRALAHDPEHPGYFWISHKTLGAKLHVSARWAKTITKALRDRTLIELVRRGYGKYHTANFYKISPLTPERLAALSNGSLKGKYSSPTRGKYSSPHCLSTKERARGRVPQPRPAP